MKNKSSRRLNRARNSFRPLQPTYQIKTCFEKEIVCELAKSLKGLSGKELTKEQEKDFCMKECGHKLWPAFMPACKKCLQENAFTKYYTNKGRKYLDVSRIKKMTVEQNKEKEENSINLEVSKDNYALTLK